MKSSIRHAALFFVLFAISACNKVLPFQKQVYRAIDDKQVVTLQNNDELEFSTNGTNLVCKYAKENNTLRVTMSMFGTTQAVYFAIIPDGLRDPQGNILYEPKKYEAVMAQINAQRRQAQLNQSLLEASKRGDIKTIESSLAQGAQLETRDDQGMTALCIASREGHLEAVRSLIQHKANPNATSSDGLTPLMFAANAGGRQGFFSEDRRPAHDQIISLLLENKAGINNAEGEGHTALMLTLFRGNLNATKLLVQAGADRHPRDRRGKTSFDYADDDNQREALRTDDEAALYRASRTPTRTIGEFRDLAPLYGLRGDELRNKPTIVTDVNITGAGSNLDNELNAWFGDIKGEVTSVDDQRQETFVSKPYKTYTVKIPDHRDIEFLKAADRDKCFDTLTKALKEWKKKYDAVLAQP